MTNPKGYTFTPDTKGGGVVVTSGGMHIGRIRQGQDEQWYRHGDLEARPYDTRAAAAKGLSDPLYTNRIMGKVLR